MSFRRNLIFLIVLITTQVFAQPGESPLRIFGYFQNQFKQEGSPRRDEETNSFLLQQLNLFFKKDLAENWTAFINFEVLNSFSVSRNTGALNLEEAWVKYRLNKKFNLKLGLLIPTFNHLNRIKNRTPLLPYIIRPLIYETSLNEIVPVDEFTPARAFVEAYGILPAGKAKVDYAFFLGNSPNISTANDPGQSGIDTTATFLVGGRFGVRFKEAKMGLSFTYDKANGFQELAERFEVTARRFQKIPRLRLGLDFSFTMGSFFFEGEFIRLDYDQVIETTNLDKEFLYATVGVRATEKLLFYGSFWRTRVYTNRPPANGIFIPPAVQNVKDSTNGPNGGVAYNINERIVVKGQVVHFDRSSNNPDIPIGPGFNIYTAAVSVIF